MPVAGQPLIEYALRRHDSGFRFGRLSGRAASGRSTGDLTAATDLAPQRFGLIEADRRGLIRRIHGEPYDVIVAEALSPAMFTGCQILEPEIFDHMPARHAFSTTHDIYPQLIRKGKALFGVQHPGAWMVVYDIARVAQATGALTSDRLRLSYLRP